jgi:hypothetical protein
MAKDVTFTIEDTQTAVCLAFETSELSSIIPALTRDYQTEIPNPVWTPQNGEPEFITNPTSMKNHALNKIASLIENFIYTDTIQEIRRTRDSEIKAVVKPNLVANVEDKV